MTAASYCECAQLLVVDRMQFSSGNFDLSVGNADSFLTFALFRGIQSNCSNQIVPIKLFQSNYKVLYSEHYWRFHFSASPPYHRLLRKGNAVDDAHSFPKLPRTETWKSRSKERNDFISCFAPPVPSPLKRVPSGCMKRIRMVSHDNC